MSTRIERAKNYIFEPRYLDNSKGTTNLQITARFFDNQNTVVLDTITNTIATLNFDKGKLLAPGTVPDEEAKLLTLLGNSPWVFSKNVKTENGAPAPAAGKSMFSIPFGVNIFASSTSDPAASSTSDPAASSTSDPAASSTSDPAASSTSDPAASSTSDPAAAPLGMADSSEGDIELQNLKKNISGGTRRYRIRKRKTVNKRRMRKSKKSRR
jgi:hypothetical protein